MNALSPKLATVQNQKSEERPAIETGREQRAWAWKREIERKGQPLEPNLHRDKPDNLHHRRCKQYDRTPISLTQAPPASTPLETGIANVQRRKPSRIDGSWRKNIEILGQLLPDYATQPMTSRSGRKTWAGRPTFPALTCSNPTEALAFIEELLSFLVSRFRVRVDSQDGRISPQVRKDLTCGSRADDIQWVR